MKKRPNRGDDVSCQWCGNMVPSTHMADHLRGTNRYTICPNYKFTDGISDIARAVLTDDEYPGTNGEEWAAGYQAEPGDKKEAEVCVYVSDGCYMIHVVSYSTPAMKKRKGGNECIPGEEELVIAQGLTNKAARALVAYLSPTTDLLIRPKDQKRMINAKYDYSAMILPQFLKDDVLAGKIDDVEAFKRAQVLALRLLKGALGDRLQRLVFSEWPTVERARGLTKCPWCGVKKESTVLAKHLRTQCPNHKFTDGISDIARAVLTDDENYPRISGKDWDAKYQAAPGDKKDSTVYIYVRKGSGYVTYVGSTGNEQMRKEAKYKFDESVEDRLVVAEGISNLSARVAEALIETMTDLTKPMDQKRMKNVKYDYSAMILPQCLKDDVLAGRIDDQEAFKQAQVLALRLLKGALGDRLLFQKDFNIDEWPTLGKPNAKNTSSAAAAAAISKEDIEEEGDEDEDQDQNEGDSNDDEEAEAGDEMVIEKRTDESHGSQHELAEIPSRLSLLELFDFGEDIDPDDSIEERGEAAMQLIDALPEGEEILQLDTSTFTLSQVKEFVKGVVHHLSVSEKRRQLQDDPQLHEGESGRNDSLETPHEFIGCEDNGYEPGGEEKVSSHRTKWDKERIKLEKERIKLEKERIKWEKERIKMEDERTKLENERTKWEDERIKWEDERIKMEAEAIGVDRQAAMTPSRSDDITFSLPVTLQKKDRQETRVEDGVRESLLEKEDTSVTRSIVLKRSSVHLAAESVGTAKRKKMHGSCDTRFSTGSTPAAILKEDKQAPTLIVSSRDPSKPSVPTAKSGKQETVPHVDVKRSGEPAETPHKPKPSEEGPNSKRFKLNHVSVPSNMPESTKKRLKKDKQTVLDSYFFRSKR